MPEKIKPEEKIKEIKTAKRMCGDVYMPGSKSITNRALLIASLSDGTTRLKNALFSDDTYYMKEALREMGISIAENKSLSEITITGKRGKILTPNKPLYLGNAGTAMRFVSSLVNLGKGDFTLTGNDRMHTRPIRDLVEALDMLGANIEYIKNTESPPLLIKANGLSGGKTRIKGKLSSQYLSSILMTAPYAEDNDVEIDIIGNLVSKPYIDMTTSVMIDFGIECFSDDYKYFKIPKGQIYKHKKEYIIEGDASNASYFFAAAAITQGKVRVYNIDFDRTTQGDIEFVLLLEQMGCTINKGQNWIEVVGAEKLRGIEVDMHDISDVVQTLAVVALFAKSRTFIKNVFNMRIKETDRIKALYNELDKLGAKVEEMKDAIIITPKEKYNTNVEIETYDDHRMAMAFSLAGLKIRNLIIKDPDCVSKTFPDYFNYLEKLYEN